MLLKTGAERPAGRSGRRPGKLPTRPRPQHREPPGKNRWPHPRPTRRLQTRSTPSASETRSPVSITCAARASESAIGGLGKEADWVSGGRGWRCGASSPQSPAPGPQPLSKLGGQSLRPPRTPQRPPNPRPLVQPPQLLAATSTKPRSTSKSGPMSSSSSMKSIAALGDRANDRPTIPGNHRIRSLRVHRRTRPRDA